MRGSDKVILIAIRSVDNVETCEVGVEGGANFSQVITRDDDAAVLLMLIRVYAVARLGAI